MAEGWRCLVIEDDVETRRYIVDGLREQAHEVVSCEDGQTGLQRACHQLWDVIILDRMLPKQMDGLSILSTLRAQNNTTPVLVLSALSDLDERVKGLKAGGDDYLTKPFAFSELYARLEALVRRSKSSEQTCLQVADLRLDLGSGKVQRVQQDIVLKPREFRLLAYLMRNADQIVTRSMLLEAVWDYHFDPQTNVIDVQISRLRSKVDQGFDTPLIHTIRGAGYMLSASPDAMLAPSLE